MCFGGLVWIGCEVVDFEVWGLNFCWGVIEIFLVKSFIKEGMFF